MPSSGGDESGTSFEMSPLVLFAEAAAVAALLPKRLDIVRLVTKGKGIMMEGSSQSLIPSARHTVALYTISAFESTPGFKASTPG